MNSIRLIFFLACQACAALAWAGGFPAELKRFVEPGTRLVSVDRADLNGDGTQDYLVVLQRGDATGTRPLLISAATRPAHSRSEAQELIVGCADCGGMMGDPLQEIVVRNKGFTVSNAGGSTDRWANSFTFAYSRRDKTWQLVRAQVDTYDAPDPDATWKTQVQRPPRDYGKIDIADFDPDDYLRKR